MLNLLFFFMLRSARDTNQEKCVQAHKVFADSMCTSDCRSHAFRKPSYHGSKPTDMTFSDFHEIVVRQREFRLKREFLGVKNRKSQVENMLTLRHLGGGDAPR